MARRSSHWSNVSKFKAFVINRSFQLKDGTKMLADGYQARKALILKEPSTLRYIATRLQLSLQKQSIR